MSAAIGLRKTLEVTRGRDHCTRLAVRPTRTSAKGDVNLRHQQERPPFAHSGRLEQAASSLNRLGFPNRHCSDSPCWLGGGQRGWPVHIRKTCATGGSTRWFGEG